MFSFDFEEFRQMDNYQKMILMISILTVMTAAGKTLVGAVSMIMNIIGPVSSAEYTEMVFGRSFGLVFSGVISLITGMLGMRAARDPGRIRPVLILSAISFALSAAGFVIAIRTDTMALRFIANVVIDGLMFIASVHVSRLVRLSKAVQVQYQ